MRLLIPFLAPALLSLALPAVAQTAAKPANDDEGFVYLMGASLGRSLSTFDFSEREIALVKQGLDDSLSDRELAVDYHKYAPRMNDYVKQRNARTAAAEKGVADAFIAKAAQVPGAVRTSSGLVYKEIRAGTGPQPTANDRVKVHYHGTLSDGTVFDSSEGGEPVVFKLNDVILCWTEALQRMKVGGEATIVCPSDLAYGDLGIPGRVRPGAALRYNVELIAIE